MAFKFNPITGNLDLVNGPDAPSGSIQYNQNGSFAGDSNLIFDEVNKRVGIQVSNPNSVLTIDSVVGGSPASPATLTATTSLQQFPNNPTIAVSQKQGPDDASGVGLSGSQVDFTGNYFSNGSVSNTYDIYAVVEVNGIYYYNGNVSQFVFNDSNSGNNFEVSLSWTPVTNGDGYVIICTGTGNFSVFVSGIGSAGFIDNGAISGSVSYSAFSSIAYPYVTPPDDSSLTAPTATENTTGGGPYYSDASTSIVYDVYAYKTLGGVNYYAGTVGTYTFTDSNSLQNFVVDVSWTPVTCDGYVIAVNGTNSLSGPISYSVDNGAATTFTDSNGGGTATIPTLFSSYVPTHNYEIRSRYNPPSNPYNYFNTSAASVTFNATNFSNGYVNIITGTLTSSPVASNGVSIQGSANRDGTFNSGFAIAGAAGSGFTVYDTTLSWAPFSIPGNYGFLGNGSTRYYRIYGTQTVGASLYYSNSPTSTSITLPNDSQYYVVNLTWSSVGGVSTFKVLRSTSPTFSSGNGSITTGGTSTSEYLYYNASNFFGNDVVTPNILVPTTVTLRSNTTVTTDPCALRLETTAPIGGNQRLEMGSPSGTSLRFGYVAATGSAFIQSTGSALDIQNSAQTAIIRLGDISSFNQNFSPTAALRFFNGLGQPIFQASTGYNTVFFGSGLNLVTSNPFTAAYFYSNDSLYSAATFRASSPSTGEPVIKILEYSGAIRAVIDRLGGARLGGSSLTPGIGLHIAGSVLFPNAQIRLDNYTGNTNTLTNGDLWHTLELGGLKSQFAGSLGYFRRTLITSFGTRTVTNTASESTTIPSSLVGSTTFAGLFFQAGKTLTIRMRGIYSTANSSQTLRIKVKLNAIVLADTGVQTLPSHTDKYWQLDVLVNCATTGTSGTFYTSGTFDIDDPNQESFDTHPLFNTGTVTVNTTAIQTLDVTAQWGAANANNKFTVQVFEVESTG